MKALKEDPELKHIIEELETGGPAAMMKCACASHSELPWPAPYACLDHACQELVSLHDEVSQCRYWNDAETMQKIGKAFGDMPGLADMFGGSAGASGGTRGVTGRTAETEQEGEEVDSPFLAAAMEGDLAAVKKFIADGAAGVALTVGLHMSLFDSSAPTKSLHRRVYCSRELSLRCCMCQPFSVAEIALRHLAASSLRWMLTTASSML